MELRENGFFTVQAFMIKRLHLKGNELMVYAIIHGFSQTENQYFTGSLDYLSSWIGGASKTTIMKSLNNLINKGLLTKEEIKKGAIKYCLYKAVTNIKIKNNLITETDMPITGTDMDDNKNCYSTITETVTNNIEYNIENNIENNIDENCCNKLQQQNLEKELVDDLENKLDEKEEDCNFNMEKHLEIFNNSPEHLINSKKNKNIILDYIKSLNIGENYKNKLIEFYNYRKNIKKKIKTIRAIDFILNQNFESEEHAILCINFAMDNEYIGVKAEYIDYKKFKKNEEDEEEPAFIEIKF